MGACTYSPDRPKALKAFNDDLCDAVRAARGRENVNLASPARGPANREAIAALRKKREPDFTRLASKTR